VVAVAAYSSYAHQRHFVLVGGADQVSAALWPHSVDGLVVLASLGLVRARSSTTVRAQARIVGGVPARRGGLASGQHRRRTHAELAAGARSGVAAAGGKAGRALSQLRPDRHRPDAAETTLAAEPELRPARSTRSRVPRRSRDQLANLWSGCRQATQAHGEPSMKG